MSTFSPNHERTLVAGFLDIHHRLDDMEALLAGGPDGSPFSEHVSDISPTEAKVVRDYFARVRSTLLACLQEDGIPLEPRRISLRWTLQTQLEFLHVAINELGPEQMRGYGTLSPAAHRAVVKIQQELERLVDRVLAYLRQGAGQDLSQRLARLEAKPGTTATLALLSRIVTRWQLVEFRPLIDTILQRLEHPRYEIAVFGRVNSGKSSLLNHVVGMEVLPVGVTPVTAVPTRIVRGDRAGALIHFAEREARRINIEELGDYASEERNPENEKHITGITVHVPFARLQEGVVLVDTPGIGSLALSGGAETLAYLPRCDLGVVLIDASAALNQEDLAVLRALYEAGIPAQVLISKADLLTPADQDRTRSYVRQQIARELNLDLEVHPVSTKGPHEALLVRWFEHEIEPLFQRHRALAEKSVERKIAHVRESVMAVLQTIVSRRGAEGQGAPAAATAGVPGAEMARQLLDQADDAILRAAEQRRRWHSEADALAEGVLQTAAHAMVQPAVAREEAGGETVVRVIQAVLVERAEMARRAVRELQQTLLGTFEAIQGTADFAGTDIAPIRDFRCSELPILVLSGLREKLRSAAPWWRRLLPRWAIPVLVRCLEKRVGPAIQECVKAYNDQLGNWMKQRIAELDRVYQSQADVLREQVRRINDRGTLAGSDDDVGDILRDLQELEKDEQGEQAAMLPTTSS